MASPTSTNDKAGDRASRDTPTDFPERLAKYRENVSKASSEEGKAFFFLEFARASFSGISSGNLEEMYPILQKHIKRKNGIAIVGRPDAFLGNLIVEFKSDLDRFGEDARSQLRRYIAILWSNQGKKRVNYLAIAADGLKFGVYRPSTRKTAGSTIEPDDILLKELDSADLREIGRHPDSAFVWFDRYLLYRTQIAPTGSDFAERFGPDSPTYKQARQLLEQAWDTAKASSQTIYEEWGRYLRYAYGTQIATEDLFLKHTFLATLAKFTAHAYYTDGRPPKDKNELLQVVSGDVFDRWNIRNFLAEDFFSWVARPEVESACVDLGRLIQDVLATFDVTSIDEDVLKTLYQELVDPTERHELGEYYTPDWLADLIVERVLARNAEKRILDPSCGSGTFLVIALHKKQEALKSLGAQKLLDHLSEAVVGVDIHPLAVIVAKTNYLLAVRDLLRKREGPFTLPIYMANSVVLPKELRELQGRLKVYGVDIAYTLPRGRTHRVTLRIPASVANDPRLLDPIISCVGDYASILSDSAIANREEFVNNLLAAAPQVAGLTDAEAAFDVLLHTAEAMHTLKKEGKDSIWTFILRNIYRPIFLSTHPFDAVVGNPPWLSFRYVQDIDYQSELKTLMKTYHIFPDSELVTHMELATLFLLRCSDLYVRPGGSVTFVMPRSVFTADQHGLFRSNTGPPGISYLLDLDSVHPLFNVPTCVVEATRDEPSSYPILGGICEGELPTKNATPAQAQKALGSRKAKFVLCRVGARNFWVEGDTPLTFENQSDYYPRVTQGATIVPRAFWIVDPAPHSKMGLDPRMPALQSSERAIATAKEDYRDVRLSGNVEAAFLYEVVTGSEVLPFGHLDLPMAVLPIERDGKGFRVLERAEAKRRGFTGLSSWLTKVEGIWREKRGEKAGKLDIYERLDWSSTLTGQSPTATFKVVYNASGTNLCAAVIRQGPRSVKVDGQSLRLRGVIADAKVYRFETGSVEEAYYFAAVLNSGLLDKLVKPMQSRGQWGERDFHKKPLEFPIPKFNPGNPKHRSLSEIGRACEEKASGTIPELAAKYSSVGKIRSMIREALRSELMRIDVLVQEIFKKAAPKLESFGRASSPAN
jgi:N-6 DNA methylase